MSYPVNSCLKGHTIHLSRIAAPAQGCRHCSRLLRSLKVHPEIRATWSRLWQIAVPTTFHKVLTWDVERERSERNEKRMRELNAKTDRFTGQRRLTA